MLLMSLLPLYVVAAIDKRRTETRQRTICVVVVLSELNCTELVTSTIIKPNPKI